MNDRLLKRMILEAIQETLDEAEDDTEKSQAKAKYDSLKTDYADTRKHLSKLIKKYERASYGNRNKEMAQKVKQARNTMSNLFNELEKLDKEYKFMQDELKDTHFSGF